MGIEIGMFKGVGVGGDSFYVADGVITGDRVVGLGGNYLLFGNYDVDGVAFGIGDLVEFGGLPRSIGLRAGNDIGFNAGNDIGFSVGDNIGFNAGNDIGFGADRDVIINAGRRFMISARVGAGVGDTIGVLVDSITKELEIRDVANGRIYMVVDFLNQNILFPQTVMRNYADDAAAAAAGVPLGGIYHSGGSLRIRIS